MNPQDDQGNSPPPDYSFLAEQPLPAATVPKKRNPKIILMIVLGVLAVIVAGASVLVPKKKVDTQASNVNADIVKQYMQAIEKGNTASISEAYAHAYTPTEDFVTNSIVKPLANIELSNCTYKESDKDSSPTQKTVITTCPIKKSNKKIVINTVVETADKKLISSRVAGVL